MTRGILIVDDNIVAALGLEAEAESCGLLSVIASNQKSALQAAKVADFAAAFVDVSLHEAFDGLEVARALAKDGRTRVMLLTGHSLKDLDGRMAGLEGVLVLSKPIDYSALRDLLQSVADSADA